MVWAECSEDEGERRADCLGGRALDLGGLVVVGSESEEDALLEPELLEEEEGVVEGREMEDLAGLRVRAGMVGRWELVVGGI